MSTSTITLELPEVLYQRLARAAQATRRPLAEVMLHALNVGSPPAWDDAPPEFQVDLAALDRMDDEALRAIALGRKPEAELPRYDDLLARNAEGLLTEAERAELAELRHHHDLFMLRKAHAAALLRWRGSRAPSP